MKHSDPDYVVVRALNDGEAAPIMVRGEDAAGFPASQFALELLYKKPPVPADLGVQVGVVEAWPDDFSRTKARLDINLPAGTPLYAPTPVLKKQAGSV